MARAAAQALERCALEAGHPQLAQRATEWRRAALEMGPHSDGYAVSLLGGKTVELASAIEALNARSER